MRIWRKKKSAEEKEAAAAEEGWKELRGSIPEPENAKSDLVWQQLYAHFHWYSEAATTARVAYQGLKLLSLLLAAAVTVLAARSAAPLVTASAGTAIVVVEGIQQLFKYHTNWIRYRVVTETLREQALLYYARQKPYDGELKAAQGELVKLLTTVIGDERKQWSVQMSSPDDKA
jgi:hypothetical protein